jgi:ATP-dependent DNA helicase DinG
MLPIPENEPEDYLSAVFDADGHLASSSEYYQPRVGQIALARVIDGALTSEEHLIAEGPCGTGKGIAYAVPAIYHAAHHGKKVVIVTANLALQDQLMLKDLPALQAALPWDFTFTALKGKANYLCKAKYEDDEVALPEDLEEWIHETKTGDKRELPVVPSDRDWSLVSTTPEECIRETCAFANDCFYYKAKDAAEDADIIVTNIHVLGAHLSLYQQLGFEVVLPRFDILIVDEAHELPSVMRNFFGFSVTERSFRKFREQVGKLLDSKRENFTRPLEVAVREFFHAVTEYVAPKGPRVRLVGQEQFVDPDPVLGILTRIEEACAEYSEEESDKFAKLMRRAQTLGTHISECTGQTDAGNKVYWVEFSDPNRRFPKLDARPLEVGGIMQKLLFERIPSVILTSATLTTTPGNFRFMRREIGVPTEALELAVPSPFDLEKQCMVVLPWERLPEDPKDPSFIDKAAEITEEVIEACNGRTLALFTSFRVLEGVRDRVGGQRTVLCQERGRGMSKAELIRRFRDEPETSLFGVDSFWTGIDVPGDSLVALVIDKLPFMAYDDPLVEAMKARDEEKFWAWYTATALLKLKQGMGRLIRSIDDVGVVVLLDRRIRTKKYGKWFVQSFGPVQKSRNIPDIVEFLKTAKEKAAGGREAFQEGQRRMVLEPKRAKEPEWVPDC